MPSDEVMLRRAVEFFVRSHGDMLTALDRGSRTDRYRFEGQGFGALSVLIMWQSTVHPNADLRREVARATDEQNAEHGERPAGDQPEWDRQLTDRILSRLRNPTLR